jgi:DNA-binding MarR family transcriptional regulator
VTASTPDQLSYPQTAERLRVALARLVRQLRQQTPGGLTLSQWSALVSVDSNGSLRIGDLAERERVSAPTATRLVAGLEEAGLLQRSSDPTDRRIAHVSLTEQGRAKLELARSEVMSSLAQRLAAMPEAEASRFIEFLPLLESLLESD